MKWEVEIDDVLWAQVRKGDAWKTHEDALTHLLGMAIYHYHEEKVKISTALIFATKKVKVRRIDPPTCTDTTVIIKPKRPSDDEPSSGNGTYPA